MFPAGIVHRKFLATTSWILGVSEYIPPIPFPVQFLIFVVCINLERAVQRFHDFHWLLVIGRCTINNLKVKNC